jgi:hypothetical protein
LVNHDTPDLPGSSGHEDRMHACLCHESGISPTLRGVV